MDTRAQAQNEPGSHAGTAERAAPETRQACAQRLTGPSVLLITDGAVYGATWAGNDTWQVVPWPGWLCIVRTPL